MTGKISEIKTSEGFELCEEQAQLNTKKSRYYAERLNELVREAQENGVVIKDESEENIIDFFDWRNCCYQESVIIATEEFEDEGS